MSQRGIQCKTPAADYGPQRAPHHGPVSLRGWMLTVGYYHGGIEAAHQHSVTIPMSYVNGFNCSYYTTVVSGEPTQLMHERATTVVQSKNRDSV
jgi:hypothetical protein